MMILWIFLENIKWMWKIIWDKTTIKIQKKKWNLHDFNWKNINQRSWEGDDLPRVVHSLNFEKRQILMFLILMNFQINLLFFDWMKIEIWNWEKIPVSIGLSTQITSEKQTRMIDYCL